MPTILRAFGMLFVMTLLTGVVYPLSVTAVAAGPLRAEAEGSLVLRDGHVVGSTLIGQPFDAPKYFWGRLSATTPFPYNAEASAGSNLGPTNEALTKAAKERVDALRAADPGNDARIPADLVTASASGLDPHISPAGAEYQAARVARARGLDVAKVRALIAAHTEDRQLGFLGEPRVDVVALNRALDAL